MGDVLAGISLAQQLYPLVRVACQRIRLLCSRKKRHAMLIEFRELGCMYAEVQDRVQSLEHNVRREFMNMITKARDALQWLSALVGQSSSRWSRWCRWKRRIQRAIFYLVGQSTLSSARRQIRSILKTLQIYELKQQQRKTSFFMVKVFRMLESMEGKFDQYCHVANSIQEIDVVLEILRMGNVVGQSITVNHPCSGSNAINGHNATTHGQCEGGSQTMTDNQDEYIKPSLSDEDNEDMASFSCGERDASSDTETDSFRSEDPASDEEQSEYNDETYAESMASDTEDYEAESVADDEMHRESISESVPSGDDAQPGTNTPLGSSTEENAQPERTSCSHLNVRVHLWNWSVIVYATWGMHITCRDCGLERSESEFSSLVQKGENGGAEINWQHISRRHWRPGVSWSCV